MRTCDQKCLNIPGTFKAIAQSCAEPYAESRKEKKTQRNLAINLANFAVKIFVRNANIWL